MSDYVKTILASTAITATKNSSIVNSTPPYESAHIVINVSAYTSGSVVPHIIGVDPVDATVTYDILVGPTINSTGTTVLKVGPGLLPTPNLVAQDMLPDGWYVSLVAAGGTAMTVSIGVNTGA